eukprot:13953284-Alexandrium_andersonii.AAC.1
MAAPQTAAPDGEAARLQEAVASVCLRRPSRAVEPGGGRRHWVRPRGCWWCKGLGGAEVRASSAASGTG